MHRGKAVQPLDSSEEELNRVRTHPKKKKKALRSKAVQLSGLSDEETDFVLTESRSGPDRQPPHYDSDDRGEGPIRPYGARPVDSDDNNDEDLPSPGRLLFSGGCFCAYLVVFSRLNVVDGQEPIDSEQEPSEPESEGR